MQSTGLRVNLNQSVGQTASICVVHDIFLSVFWACPGYNWGVVVQRGGHGGDIGAPVAEETCFATA